MTDTVFNLIVILIPVAIVIGRIVMGARNKRNPPPRPAQPHIPVHFEDDNSYFRNRMPAATPETKPRVPTPPPKLATLAPNEAYLPATGSGVKPATGRPVAAAAAPSGHRDFTLSLSHLSPLKQAVVMAEILGPPKGME
jgi:hypothetical protein